MGPSAGQEQGTTQQTAIHWEYVSWDTLAEDGELPADVADLLRDLNVSCYRKVSGDAAAGYLCTTPPGPLDEQRGTQPTVARAAREVLNEHWDALEGAADALNDFITMASATPSRPLRQAELLKLVLTLPEGAARAWATWLFYTGARLSELEALRWSHVDLKARVVRLESPKVGSVREVRLTVALELWCLQTLQQSPSPSEAVLPPCPSFRQDLAQVAAELGLGSLTAQRIRAGYREWARSEGQTDPLAAQALGLTSSPPEACESQP